MRILLSAYACEPNHGSEPGVGWHWAVELVKLGHDITVLTRENNKQAIEGFLTKNTIQGNLSFVYYDLPLWVRRWKKGGRGIRLYYLLWQLGAYRVAKNAHKKFNFDQVHHVTFVSIRQPSFMGGLGIPFIFGPVGGGERAPLRLRSGYGLHGWVLDFLRDIANFFVKIDPLMRHTFKSAKKIYVTSEQTKKLIPKKFRGKAHIQLAIGCNEIDIKKVEKNKVQGFNVLYVGRFLYWKGMSIGLAAFAKFSVQFPEARLTLVGKGRDEARWRELSKELGIIEKINWMPWVDKAQLEVLYSNHDVFLFPSLHDSGGMVVLEAMAQGLPIVCLQQGGPGIIVDESCGAVVATKNVGKTEVLDDMAGALLRIGKNPALYKQLSKGALNRVEKFSWKNLVESIYVKRRDQ